MQPLPHSATSGLAESIQAHHRLPKIIVGLGNPGRSYSQTRHNFGFDIIDQCASFLKFAFSRDRDTRSEIARGNYVGRDLLLLKPLTYMNLSGRSLLLLRKALFFEPHQLLVICDDIALPFGAMRLRYSGGSGGHNGLKSIQQSLGSIDFARLRLGIGQPPFGMALDVFVLAAFSDAEKSEIAPIAAKGVKSALAWVEGEQDRPAESIPHR